MKKNRKLAPKLRRKRMPRGRPFVKGNRAGEAHWFRPGQTGNPLGGPKYAEISQALRHFLALEVSVQVIPKTHAERVAWRWLRAAEKGNLGAMCSVADRAEGKPRQAVEFLKDDPLGQLLDEMRAASEKAGPPEEWVDDEAKPEAVN